jgi:hypothetical protein
MKICKKTSVLAVLCLMLDASCVYSAAQTIQAAPPQTDKTKHAPVDTAPTAPASSTALADPGVPATPTLPVAQTPVPTVPVTKDTPEAKDPSTATSTPSLPSDVRLQLGIGSLLRNGDVTDYVNNANTLSATSLGWATPQYLVGLAMRAPFPNFKRYGTGCAGVDAASPGDSTAKKTSSDNTCPIWRQRPWGGFVSLKFSPNSSQTINGYVLGGSYSLTSYLDLMAGFSLTPVNVPASGLRNAAYNYVLQQQKLGNDLQFNPQAMLNNSQNAFDGFSLLDSTGKLIYTGTPLEVDYRGGVVIGVSIPLDFGKLFTSQKP